MHWQVLGVIVVTLIVYLLLGGLVFWRLESRHDLKNEPQQQQQSMVTTASSAVNYVDVQTELLDYINDEIDRKQQQTSNYAAVVNNTSVCISKNELLSIINNWTDIKSSQAEQEHQFNWNLPGSIFFAITVITTIGYGNLVPRSAGARAFCCLYSIVGIPLCLVALVNIGSQIDTAARWAESRLRQRYRRRRRRVSSSPGGDNGAEDEEEEEEAAEAACRMRCRYAVRLTVIAVVGAVVFLLIPAAVFCRLQDWDYGTAVYFAVVSLSTIGFGDYVAGINYVGPLSALYRLSVGIWIFLGLAWLAGVMSSLQECFQTIAKRVDTSLPLTGKKRGRLNGTFVDDAAAETEFDNHQHGNDTEIASFKQTTKESDVKLELGASNRPIARAHDLIDDEKHLTNIEP